MKFDREKLEGLLKTAESEGIFNKAVAGFILPDGHREIISLNTSEKTVFDIASLTKVCPTSTLALSYILEGSLSVDTKVIDYIPELQTNYREDIRVFHLLTHSLDYRVPMKTLRTLPAEGILNALYTYQFEKAPGAAARNHSAAAQGQGPATTGTRAVLHSARHDTFRLGPAYARLESDSQK